MHTMVSFNPVLVDEIGLLKEALTRHIRQLVERDQTNAALTEKIERLQQQFLNLRRLHFGATSEKFAGQAELFTEKVDLPVPPEPQ